MRLVCVLSPRGKLGACRYIISEAVRVHIVAQSLDLFSRIGEICYCSAARIYTTHVS
jgi:hypothetical protein